jgi:hypothetical protein
MTLQFSLTVSDNLQIFGFFLLKSVSRAKNSIWTSGVNDFYPRCIIYYYRRYRALFILYFIFFHSNGFFQTSDLFILFSFYLKF